jgi:PAS domain S-box-containing protein
MLERSRLDLRAWAVFLGCALVSALILAIDVRIERSLALGIPQILVVLVALLARRSWVTIAAAAVATLSIALGDALSPSGALDGPAFANRILTGSAVWMTALAGVAFERGAAANRHLAEIVEASSDAIARVNLDGVVTAWNAAAERLYGWRADEVLDTPVLPELRTVVERVSRGDAVETFEAIHRRRDGVPLEVSVAVCPLHDARGRIRAASVSVRDIAPLKRAERALRELNASLAERVKERTAELERSMGELAAEVDRRLQVERDLRSLTAELALIEERERRQLAQDLHDGLGQTLTLAIMRLGMLRECVSDERQGKLLADVERTLCAAQTSATSLTFRLSPPILYDVGFVAAVQWLCDELERSYGLEVRLDDDDQPKILDDHMRVVLFRCVRELLINVAKHSGADRAEVSLRRSADQLRVIVSDRGSGFDPEGMRGRGFGVASVRERIEHLGGHLSIESELGRGTRATIVAPLVMPDTASEAGA